VKLSRPATTGLGDLLQMSLLHPLCDSMWYHSESSMLGLGPRRSHEPWRPQLQAGAGIEARHGATRVEPSFARRPSSRPGGMTWLSGPGPQERNAWPAEQTGTSFRSLRILDLLGARTFQVGPKACHESADGALQVGEQHEARPKGNA
jgi:hypothetical protein